MTSEFVRAIMNNISKKDIDTTYENNIKDKYEMQKNISLSKYSSNYNSNSSINVNSKNSSNGKNKKAIDLNSLANKVRGVDGKDNTVGNIKKEKVKTNKLTLDDLSKLSKGKDEGSNTYNTPEQTSFQKEAKINNFSLDRLTQSIKKNI